VHAGSLQLVIRLQSHADDVLFMSHHLQLDHTNALLSGICRVHSAKKPRKYRLFLRKNGAFINGKTSLQQGKPAPMSVLAQRM
jgi:hypothetical protein